MQAYWERLRSHVECLRMVLCESSSSKARVFPGRRRWPDQQSSQTTNCTVIQPLVENASDLRENQACDLNEAFMNTAHLRKCTKPKCPIITVFRFSCDIIFVSPPKDLTESRESESRKEECHPVLECMLRCETPRFTPILRAHVSRTIHPSASAISLNTEPITYF